MNIAEKLTTIAENEQRVYDSGKENGFKEWMQKYQDNANRKRTIRQFAGSCWNAETFYPVEDIKLDTCTFEYHNWDSGCANYDFAQRLAECGVEILWDSKYKSPNSLFAYMGVTRLPELNFSTMTTNNLQSTFYYSIYLKTIDKLILGENRTAGFTDTFGGCNSLQNIVIEGVIPQNISFSNSPLTYESAVSVISALKDYSGTANAYKYTVNFSSVTWEYLDTEGNASPNKSTWREYIQSLGWNC